MRRSWLYYSVLLSLGIAAALAWALDASTGGDAPTTRNISIELDLGGPAKDAKGLQLDTGRLGFGWTYVTEPHQIVIHLRDGTCWRSFSRFTAVWAANWKVLGVNISPLPSPVSFGQLKSNLFDLLARFGIDDSEIRDELSKYPDDETPPPSAAEPIIVPSFKPVRGLGLDVVINGNPSGWFYSVEFNLLSPGLMDVMSPTTQPTADRGGPIGSLEVNLGKSAQGLPGALSASASHGFQEIDLLRPENLTIHFIDGKSASIIARSTHIFCFNGLVRCVFIRRPPTPEPFAQAKADLLQTLNAQPIELDSIMKRMIANFPQNAPMSGDSRVEYLTGLGSPTNVGLDLTARLRPDPRGGWYYFLIFNTQWLGDPTHTDP